MTSRFTELSVDCHDPAGLAAFWCSVLGYRVVDEEPDLVGIASEEATPPTIVFVRVPEAKTIKNRLHMDVNPVDRDQDDEVARLLDLGARHADVGQGPNVSWRTLTDPEGNEFCVLRSRVAP